MKQLKLAVFASGKGSNFAAILNAIEQGRLDAKTVVVCSNKSDAGVLSLARSRDIDDVHIAPDAFESQEDFDRELLRCLEQHGADFIVLVGYLKMISQVLIKQFRNRILNIHPALLPAFGGRGMYGKHVHQAVIAYGCKVSGVTVHLVDESYDSGPPVMQRCVPVLPEDDADTLAARVLEQEHIIYSEALQLFAEGRVSVRGRRVIVHEKVV